MKANLTKSIGTSQLLRNGFRQTALAMTIVFLAWLFAGTALGVNLNPKIIPPHAKPHGKSYGEWGAAWMAWTQIPAAENPILDTTGQFGDVGQSGPVWFLPGTTFGISAERTLSVPKGKALFFPVLDTLWWAPNDLPLAALVAQQFLGLDPDTLADEELIRLLARFAIGPDAELTLTIDGVTIQNLEQYRADSPFFHLAHTELIDDLGVPIADDHMAVADGYWVMLAPLTPGSHVIHFTARLNNPFFGPFEATVTHHLLVQ